MPCGKELVSGSCIDNHFRTSPLLLHNVCGCLQWDVGARPQSSSVHKSYCTKLRNFMQLHLGSYGLKLCPAYSTMNVLSTRQKRFLILCVLSRTYFWMAGSIFSDSNFWRCCTEVCAILPVTDIATYLIFTCRTWDFHSSEIFMMLCSDVVRCQYFGGSCHPQLHSEDHDFIMSSNLYILLFSCIKLTYSFFLHKFSEYTAQLACHIRCCCIVPVQHYMQNNLTVLSNL